MKVVTNTKLIKRNAKIGQYTSIGALVILGIGLYISFKMPDKFAYSLGALLLGFFMSQIGMYYGNRWGRSPRPDELIDKGLKGLGREYTIYHYVTAAPHLLVGPAGVWTLMPYYQSGIIVYEKKRWKSRGGGFLQSYLRLFGQENLGRPEIESETGIESIKRYLTRILPEGSEVPPIKSLLLFTSPKVELKVEDPPLPTITPKDLKDFMREKSKEEPIGALMLDTLLRALPKPDREE
ncbi:MAG: hypothetical protein IMZ62_10945 [Chloroflexi bacterium]|nr:hypothetical protein [Chloroflexota bacterium]MBE3119863.1 hypothetical protein [Candidatus Atribacteria bacterium]